VTAERWTRLDRVLAREAGAADGVIDLRPDRALASDPLREIRIGRIRNLERLGLAEPAGPARWILAADAEQRLRDLGERGDIIKRLHKSLTRDGSMRAPSSWALEGESHGEPVIGRLIARGLDDELRVRRSPSSTGSMGVSTTSSSPILMRPVTVRSAASWNYVGLRI
jgi:type IV secretory pathway VirD2 relaxase